MQVHGVVETRLSLCACDFYGVAEVDQSQTLQIYVVCITPPPSSSSSSPTTATTTNNTGTELAGRAACGKVGLINQGNKCMLWSFLAISSSAFFGF
jgi:hypothetical protein